MGVGSYQGFVVVYTPFLFYTFDYLYFMGITLRYDLRRASEMGYKEHPQLVMEKLGYKLLSYQGVPILDCIMIEVENIIDPLPRFLEILSDF